MHQLADLFRRNKYRAAAASGGAALVLIGVALGVAAQAGPSGASLEGPVLRVCSDPDNMPFSNADGQGFENRLAELVAGELGKRVSYTWATQDDNFIHGTLKAGRCDVLVGVPQELGSAETTRPYYWSSYVLISRSDRHLGIDSLKDHRLRKMKIAVPSFAGNRLFSPPAQSLAAAGMLDNLVGFPIDGSAGGVDPKQRIIDAVANGDIDVAALWGPQAGYFVQRSPVPLAMNLIGDTDEFSARKTHFELHSLQYEIAMGVRNGDDKLRDALDAVIARKEAEIDALLRRYGVPLIEPARVAAATADGSSDWGGRE